MKSSRAFAVLAAGLAGGATAVGGASADVIRASHTPAYVKNINVTAQDLFSEPITILPTATFGWTLADGPSEGSNFPGTFTSFCLQAGQPAPQGVIHEYEVLTLEQAGYSADQREALSKLWTAYRGSANSIDSSAAFQIAVWEIVHDQGLDVTSGAFVVNSWGDARDTAQLWLGSLADMPLPEDGPQFRVLSSGSAQNQLMVVPAPGAGALLVAAMGAAGARRRRR